ncbi:gamma-butyrolactone biosynthesis protein [Nocardiopsis gilva YIM 90087]|uniref:Gamma-butyrolactone biosynthesis protein n=1 Tax=Nocardiopsis gilva YIM 90087 TaxID=1235441 RepID=A0A223SD08_9ACTN|nr:ScbA/BarX family gamma-butyrolactone biosynthesis protein [Nocardiopsis gilva]ASU85992.1 gamma-butyrolactone biosynthesis protein [Nocardiopsis gilva YIM 90087]
MSIAVEADRAPDVLSELNFAHTVDKQLVHRRALSEVFLTDSSLIDESRFVAAAQLPPSHAYYTDHTTPNAIDPLLLLECCRQAETHAVHAHFGAPIGTKFVLQEWSMDLPGLASMDPVLGPTAAVVSVDTHDARWLGGELRSLAYRMRIRVGDQSVGEVRMRVKYVADDVYAMLRGRRNDGPLPTSDAYRATAVPGLAAPGRVGRRREENVILLDPAADEHGVQARLRVAGGHPSLFDHAQDHVPGMVLMEAGRQISLLAAEEFTGVPAESWYVSGLDASFGAYAELDAPLMVRASRPERSARDAEFTVRVTFEQDERAVATAVFTGARGEGGERP